MLRERVLAHPLAHRDRVTATEVIDGIECLVELEQDTFGRYREKSIRPKETTEEIVASSSCEIIEFSQNRQSWFSIKGRLGK